MERLTNDRNKYLNQIKFELIDFIIEKDWKTLFEYVELPFFLTYAFSYSLSANLNENKIRLISRDWNAKYDNERFNKGIYNIDRLAIIEHEINLSKEDMEFLQSTDINKLETNKFEGIVLDGLICELKMPKIKKKLQWNIDNEMNEELSQLVNKLRNLKMQTNT